MTDLGGPSAAFEVRFTATARRGLNTLPPRVLSAVVEFAFGDLAREPRRVGKPLRDDLAGLFSAVVGLTACSIESTTLLASSSSSEWTTALTSTGPNRCRPDGDRRRSPY